MIDPDPNPCGLAPDVSETMSLDQADGTITVLLQLQYYYSVSSRILNDATCHEYMIICPEHF
jgi:hypothetical protein